MNEWEINKGLEIFFGDGGLKEKVVIREVVIYGNWGLVIRKLCSTAVMCIEKEKDSDLKGEVGESDIIIMVVLSGMVWLEFEKKQNEYCWRE